LILIHGSSQAVDIAGLKKLQIQVHSFPNEMCATVHFFHRASSTCALRLVSLPTAMQRVNLRSQ
jgi:hypothetical protein